MKRKYKFKGSDGNGGFFSGVTKKKHASMIDALREINTTVHSCLMCEVDYGSVATEPLACISGPVELFHSGQCMAFDNGEQVGPLQKTFFSLWAENAVNEGWNPDGVVVRTPRGNAKIFKMDSGWSFQPC